MSSSRVSSSRDRLRRGVPGTGGALQIVVDEATYVIPLEGVVDLNAERARLSASRSLPLGRSGLDLAISTPKQVTLVADGRKRTVTTTALGLSAALALAACGGDAKDASAGGGPIAVRASDTECSLARAEAPAGTVEFEVKNTGSKVNEFYVYAEGDRIVGEVENIAPGLSRTFHVNVSEPGTYVTACKPGMVGAGIRSDFTITGASAAPKSQDEQLVARIDPIGGAGHRLCGLLRHRRCRSRNSRGEAGRYCE